MVESGITGRLEENTERRTPNGRGESATLSLHIYLHMLVVGSEQVQVKE